MRMWEQRGGGGPPGPIFEKQEVSAMNSSGSASGRYLIFHLRIFDNKSELKCLLTSIKHKI